MTRQNRLPVAGPALFLSLALAGCAAAPVERPLVFFPPSAQEPVTSFASTKSPSEIASAFRAAGFGDVSVVNRGRTVRVRSTTDRMIDCGSFQQSAFGNSARFPGSAPRAALIGIGVEGELLVRTFAVLSEANLTTAGPGRYAVSERHRVTVEYQHADGRPTGRRSTEFTESVPGSLDDGTSCRSSGLAGGIN